MVDYVPRPEVTELLRGKTLVMIVGPTSVGKSTLMNEVTRLDSEFKRVSGFTTRQPRTNDEPGLYRYLSEAAANELIQTRQLVQYVTHPTTDFLYGTQPEDFQGHYSLQDTLSSTVGFYRNLPFDQHIVISLCAPIDAWLKWLDARFPEQGDEWQKRLIESKTSIEWSLAQTNNHHWLINQPGQLEASAHQLIKIVRSDEEKDYTDEIAVSREMLRTITTLI